MRVALARDEGVLQPFVRFGADGAWVAGTHLRHGGLHGFQALLAAMCPPADRVRESLWQEWQRLALEPEAREVLKAEAPYLPGAKVLGIGLNYREHATDLNASPPDEPASFLKGAHCIIGPDDVIRIPASSQRVTSEAELGVVFGARCYQVPEREALDHIAGVVPILDQTAEDILQRNPRFLTRAKNYPTFLAMGPEIVSLDELADVSLGERTVSTVRNGVTERSNTVGNMIFPPRRLIAIHSEVMPFFPGDVISTGTPGAAAIQPGDVLECRISGLPILRSRTRSATTD